MLFSCSTNIERKRKKYLDIYNEENEVKEEFKGIRILPLINPIYIDNAFSIIKSNNKFKILEDFMDYFENTFLKAYDIEWWNYFNQSTIRTNNSL